MIVQTGDHTFETQSRGHTMTLVRQADGWEMWTSNASSRAWNGGIPGVKTFRTLEEVETHYQSWKGVSRLVSEPGTLNAPVADKQIRSVPSNAH